MFENRPILIVEDECYLALDLANAVEDWRGEVVGPAATVAEAMALLDARDVDAAILDSQLADRDVTPLALELSQRGVPFVISTGTGLPPGLASSLPNVAVVMKPARAVTVLECLLNEIRKPARRSVLEPRPRNPAG
jgi:DNA-binding NtrC family response regulator